MNGHIVTAEFMSGMSVYQHDRVLSYKGSYLFYRDATGKFPEYPDEDEGGSAAIFKEKDPAEMEAELKAKVNSYLL